MYEDVRLNSQPQCGMVARTSVVGEIECEQVKIGSLRPKVQVFDELVVTGSRLEGVVKLVVCVVDCDQGPGDSE